MSPLRPGQENRMQKCLKCGVDCDGVLCADCRLAELEITGRLPQRRPLKAAEPVRVEVKLETVKSANAIAAERNRREWSKRKEFLESFNSFAPKIRKPATQKKKKKKSLAEILAGQAANSTPSPKRKTHVKHDRYGGAIDFKRSQKVLAERLEYRARMAKKTEANQDYHRQEEG
jgi:hypothetical protein